MIKSKTMKTTTKSPLISNNRHRLDDSPPGNRESGLCVLPRDKTRKATAKVESHVDNLDLYLHLKV